tara:strand:- start:14883 stop:16352 length:1470 start_codon:yes stop_codon:yes gene_type:complete
MKIKDKWFVFPILVLFIHFIYRLVNQSKILKVFPLDYTNDWSSYMAQLFFLDNCGYSNFCEYWYNGIITLKFAPPGWYFFTWPLFKLTNNVLVSAFSSLIIIFILGFIVFYFFGRLNKFSLTKIIAYFLFFFGNAVAIGNFIRLGRVNELFAWLNFLVFAFILLWYKDKRIDKNFFWSSLFFAIILISHQATAVLSAVLLFGLFLIKKGKEKFYVVLTGLISLLLSSFWLIPYILGFFNTEAVNVVLTGPLSFSLSEIAMRLVPLLLFVTFYFYYKSNNESKKEFIFFLPTLIVALLLFLGITFYVPILKFVYPDSHIYFFIFLIIYMFFKIDFNVFNNLYKKIIFIGLILLPLISVAFNVVVTPNFIEYTDLEKDTLEVLERVQGRYIILADGFYSTSYSRAYYSYGAIFLNKSTSSGWYQQYTTQEYFAKLKMLNTYLKNNDPRLLENLQFLNTNEIIGYDESCDRLKEFNFEERFKKGRVCLFSYE